MKKTIIALFALAGVAAAETITSSIMLPAGTNYTWVAGNGSGIGTGATASAVESLATAITAAGVDWTGWFGGTGQGYASDSTYAADISINSDSSFSFKSRPALSGEYVALGVALPEAAESITLSFDTTNKLGYSVWSYDGTTATELIGLTYQSAAGPVSKTYDADIVGASQLFVLWTANHPSGNAGGGTAITVSNIALSYSVPEPTTATLSLLALAGLAARRRRK